MFSCTRLARIFKGKNRNFCEFYMGRDAPSRCCFIEVEMFYAVDDGDDDSYAINGLERGKLEHTFEIHVTNVSNSDLSSKD